MHIRCPHCHNPLELLDNQSMSDIPCPSCGSSFSLVDDADTTEDYEHTTKKIGHFRLIRQLGVGAFGAVWQAHDLELDREVALKIPRRSQLDSPDDAEKFLREARAAAQLNHKNIVRVYEVGREHGQIYIASELIHGVTLADRLETGPLSARESAELGAMIANALHHAHDQGVIHRDLKPSNILLDANSAPFVADFGMAKRERSGEITMTLDGAILGTPAYMPPEQAKGEGHDADCRSDIYSLGVMLFECLTGNRPFRGNKRMLLHMVIHAEAPSLRNIESSVPIDLQTITLKCLEKDPSRRFQSADELARELRLWLDGRPIQSRPISATTRFWRLCKRQPLVSALTAAVILALTFGFAISMWQWHRADRLLGETTELKQNAEDRNRTLLVRSLSQSAEKAYRDFEPNLAMLLAAESVELSLREGKQPDAIALDSLKRLASAGSRDLLTLPNDMPFFEDRELGEYWVSQDCSIVLSKYDWTHFANRDSIRAAQRVKDKMEYFNLDSGPGSVTEVAASRNAADVFVDHQNGSSWRATFNGSSYTKNPLEVHRAFETWGLESLHKSGLHMSGPGGRWLAYVDRDRMAYIVDLDTTDGPRQVGRTTGAVDFIRVSGGGRWLVCGNEVGASLFDSEEPADNALVHQWSGNVKVGDWSFSPDERWLAIKHSLFVKLFDLQSMPLKEKKFHGEEARFFAPGWVRVDGRNEANEEQSRCWRLADDLSSEPTVSFPPKFRVLAQNFGDRQFVVLQDSKSPISYLSGGKSKLYEWSESGIQPTSAIQLGDYVKSALISRQGLLVANRSIGIAVYDLNGSSPKTILDSKEYKLAVISPDNKWVAALLRGDSGIQLFRWNGMTLSKATQLALAQESTMASPTVQFSGDSRWLIASGRDVQVLNLESLKSERLEVKMPWPLAFADHSSTNLLVLRPTNVGVWPLDGRSQLASAPQRVIEFSPFLTRVAFGRNGGQLVLGFSDGECQIARFALGRLIVSGKNNVSGYVNRLHLSPDEHWVCASTQDGSWLFRTDDPESATRYSTPLKFSPAGRWAARTDQGRCELVDLASAEPQAAWLQASASLTSSLAFSPDEKWLAIAGDEIVYLWSLPLTGAEPETVEGFQGEVTELGFSRDSKWMFMIDENGTKCRELTGAKRIRQMELYGIGPDVNVQSAGNGRWFFEFENGYYTAATIWSFDSQTDEPVASVSRPTVLSKDGTTLAVSNRIGKPPLLFDLVQADATLTNLRKKIESLGVDLRSDPRSLTFHPSERWLIETSSHEMTAFSVNGGEINDAITIISVIDRPPPLRQTDHSILGSFDNRTLVYFSPDGRWLLLRQRRDTEEFGTKADGLTLQYFPFDDEPAEIVKTARSIAGRELTRAERRKYLLTEAN